MRRSRLNSFRIAQEAVTNVVRHADAQHLTVTINEESGLITLEVADDGVGIQGNPDGHHGIGLVSMRERCLRLGGQWSVRPGDEGGTVVTSVIPCPPRTPSPTTETGN